MIIIALKIMKMMAGRRATATDTTEDPGTKCAGASWKFFSSFIAFIVPVPETGQSGDEIPEPALIYPRFPFFSRGKIKNLILYRKQGTPPSACDTPPRIKNQGKNPLPAWNFIHLCFCPARVLADVSPASTGLAPGFPLPTPPGLLPVVFSTCRSFVSQAPGNAKGGPRREKAPPVRSAGLPFSLSTFDPEHLLLLGPQHGQRRLQLVHAETVRQVPRQDGMVGSGSGPAIRFPTEQLRNDPETVART